MNVAFEGLQLRQGTAALSPEVSLEMLCTNSLFRIQTADLVVQASIFKLVHIKMRRGKLGLEAGRGW